MSVRGEKIITFGGKERKLRPTFAAIVDVETRSKTSMFGLAEKITRNAITVADIAAVLHAGFKGAGEEITYEQVCETLMEEGVYVHLGEVGDYIVQICTAGRKPPEGEATETPKTAVAEAKPG